MLFLIHPDAEGAQTRQVPQDYQTIQAAIDAAADGDEVLVLEGLYKGPGNRDIDLRGKAITVRSATKTGPQQVSPETSIIDCEGKGRGFILQSGEGPGTKIEGFTIRNGKADLGAGIYISSKTDGNGPIVGTGPSVTDCILIGNSATLWGGGIYVAHYLSVPLITGCRFLGNTAAFLGGAVFSFCGAALEFRNCLFSGNTALARGGGLYAECGHSRTGIRSLKIVNCTFSENRANEGGGLYFRYGVVPQISNSILWNDRASVGREIVVDGSVLLVLRYTNIAGGIEGGIMRNGANILAGAGVMAADPQFVNPLGPDGTPGTFDDDLRLGYRSPCIDAGDPRASVGSEPDPNGGLINLGAFGGTLEATRTFSDSDGDGLPDYAELAGCTDPSDADTDDDGIPDGVEDANLNGVWDAGETDPCNPDTDQDGLQDGTELGYTEADLGEGTSLAFFQPDLDPSQVTDPLASDTDQDGISDGEEDANTDGRVGPGETDPRARDYFVAKWGSDAQGNGSKAKPWLTIQHAVDTAQEISGMQMVIHIAAGTYPENLVLGRPLSLDGGWGEDFMEQWDFRGRGILPDAAHETIIDGGGAARPCIQVESPFGMVSISGLTIRNGRADAGGGIHCRFDSYASLSYSTIVHNTAKYGGGIYCGYFSYLRIQNSEVSGNTADFGAGIFLDESAGAQIQNSLFRGNVAIDAGGAIFHEYGSYSVIENCTVARNQAATGGACYFDEESGGSIRNAILWYNTATGTQEIYQETQSYVSVSYSNVDQVEFADRDGNIRKEPLFANEQDFRLAPGSPCIDSGDDAAALPDVDLDGNERRFDGDGDGRTTVDMGAYEFTCDPCQADLDRDGDIDSLDLALLMAILDSSAGKTAGDGVDGSVDLPLFAFGFGKNNCPLTFDPCQADLDGDGDIDGLDLALFISALGSSLGESTYIELADFSGDGRIDEADLAFFTAAFGGSGCH